MKIKKFKPTRILFFALSFFIVMGLFWVMSLSATPGSNCLCMGKSAQFGGGGGSPFDDGPFYGTGVTIKKIIIRSGARVDAIQVEWLLPCGDIITGTKHGGDGGEAHTIELADDEYITAISGRSGAEIDQITFFTNKANVYGPYGGTGGSPFKIDKVHVCGFFGRNGVRIDAIGVTTK